MNLQTLKIRLLSASLIVIFFNSLALSQAVVERSKNKVVISGVTYYLHEVKKGETIYSISKAYGLTTDQLAKENPSISAGLREGQSLRIPASLVNSVPANQPPVRPETQRDEGKFIYHKLEPGETVYNLSKTFNVSENDIIRSNPGIDINKLPLGYEIAIPRKDFMNEKQNFAQKDQQAYYHKVTMGETMASIARKYGLSVRELRRANRDIRFPQVGDYLMIPGMKAPESKPLEVIVQDTVLPVTKEEVEYLEHPSGYLPVRNLRGSYNVGVMLPFFLEENMKRSDIDSSRIIRGKKVYKVIERPEDWIYPRSLGFVEMYEGILLAADTLRSLGIDVKLHVFDIASDTAVVTRLIASGRLDNLDLIIGPVFSRNLALVASYAGSRGIPVVSPVQLSSSAVLNGNPLLFMANPTTEVAEKAIIKKAADYYNDNFVIIHSDSQSDSAEYARFKSEIVSELASRIPYEEIKLKDFVFYSRSLFGNDSINRLEHAFSAESPNVVIIASDDGPLMSESLTDVHALKRKFSINVFGYPGVRYLDNLDHKICFDLGLMVYSPFWIDYAKDNVMRFNARFRQKFFTEPSEISYAWQGYDIVYYFLSGLSIHGKEFLVHPEIHNVELLHSEYDFRRRSVSDGFENNKLYLIRYSNNYDLELAGETGGDYLK